MAKYSFPVTDLVREADLIAQVKKLALQERMRLAKLKFDSATETVWVSLHKYQSQESMLEVAKTKPRMMAFRAECILDVFAFAGQLWTSEHKHERTTIAVIPDGRFPDVDVVMQTRTTRTALMDCMRKVQDSHVMIQTLEPVATYTGKRDYARE